MWYVKAKDELYHHGIKGQKWGVRRFQNEDGSYTAAGRKRYGYDERSGSSDGKSRKGLSDKQKKALKIGAAVTATALVAVGGYALYKSGKLDAPIGRGRSVVNLLKEKWDGYKGPVASLRAEAASMNDAVLGNAVKRANLENAYVKAYQQRMNDPKESRFDNILKALGTASATVVSAKALRDSFKKDNNEKQKQAPHLSTMSDQELREKVNRANLENQYRNLYRNEAAANKEPSKVEKAIDKGQKAVKTAQSLEEAEYRIRKRKQ